MSYQTVFKRYELKYLLSCQQRSLLSQAMQPHMSLDQYGHTTIRNVYYDTDNYRLVRHSIEKPVYKEKLRVRSYCRARPDAPVFVELKKKYQSVVYKRRLALPERDAIDWLCAGNAPAGRSQIEAEVEYFRQYYQTLRPVVFLSYEREAFYALDGGDFRVTFDENILARQDALSLEADVWGQPLLRENQVLMEIKTSGGIPLWMTRFLSGQRIFKTSFSKYGTAYQKMILGRKGERTYV